jgi:hypothetical protein
MVPLVWVACHWGSRSLLRPLACYLGFGYFFGHLRPIRGINPNRSAKIPLLKWCWFYFSVKLNLRRVGAAPKLGHNTCELSKLCTVTWAWHMVHSCENTDTTTEQQKVVSSNLGLGQKKCDLCARCGCGYGRGVGSDHPHCVYTRTPSSK